MVSELQAWLAENPPADMPYWPGARCTGRVGLRKSQSLLDAGASPLHLGVDRAGGDDYLCPFDARVSWALVGGVAGSVLRIVPEHLDGMEIQVFHTVAYDSGVHYIETRCRKGDRMPIKPGALGLSAGVHTHTEVVMRDSDKLRDWMEDSEAIVHRGEIIRSLVTLHCAQYDMDRRTVLTRLAQQIQTWRIVEATQIYAVREALPDYRAPGFRGMVCLVDSLWLLDI